MRYTLLLAVIGALGVCTSQILADVQSPSETGFPPPTMPAEKVEINLPGKADSMRPGGGERYLIFHRKDAGKLDIVDLSKLSVVGQLDAPSDAVFAASREKLVIARTGQQILQRWNLSTRKREKTIPLPGDRPILKAVMGADGDGPLALWADGPVQLWDVERMKPMAVKGKVLEGSKQYGFGLRVSADGRTFCGWTTGISGQRYSLMRIEGNGIVSAATPDDHSYNERWAQPNADGSLLLRSGGLYSADIQPLPLGNLKDAILMPCVDKRFLLALSGSGEKNPSEVSIYTAQDRQRLYTIRDLEPLNQGVIGTLHGRFGDEMRVRYIPRAKVLVTIPFTNDRVVVRQFDLADAIKETGADYLYAISKPPVLAGVGQDYDYQIETLSSSKKVKYQLESGPEGMSLSGKGKVRWKIRQRPVGGKAKVIVSVTNGDDQEAFHSWNIFVVRRTVTVGRLPPRATTTDKPEPGETTTEPAPATVDTDPPATSPQPAGRFVRIDEKRLELPAGPDAITPGLGGRMLVLSGDQLAVLGPDGWTVQKTLSLGKPYIDIGERKSHYVAVSNEPQSVDLIDKQTTQVTKSLKLSYMSLTDLALHPTEPWSYVAFKHDIKPPRYKFILFNEQTGEGREGEDLIGKWLLVEPRGRWLVAGYADIFRSGSRLILNPKQWHVTPEYGSLDWLIRYRIGADGVPVTEQTKEQAGGNGQGIRMSPDGRRVTYLSFVGYPKFSRNLAGWDPTDLQKLPVTYATKDRATTHDLAYHPQLPLVASHGSGSAVFFHRDTGGIEANRLQIEADELDGVKVHRIFFAPDGEHLVFDTEISGVRYLHKTALRLEPDERKRVQTARTEETVAREVPPLAEVRTWNDRTGQYRVRATFLGVADGKVQLRREDGREVSVPLNRLSETDQQYVRRQNRD